MGDQKYIKFGETGYHLIQQDGKDLYQVITVENDYDAILNARSRL